MHRRYTVLFAVLALTVCGIGCDTQGDQDAFREAASRVPEGFTRVADDGTVGAVDEDDWRTAPAFIGIVRVSPAQPNPVNEGFVNISASVFQFNRVRGGLRVEALDASRRLVTLDDELQASSPGTYVLTFSPALLGRTGLVRLFVTDGFGRLVSYGDLMIE